MERFITLILHPGIHNEREIYQVVDQLTGRVRECTYDLEDANAVALWLNAEKVYDGGELIVA